MPEERLNPEAETIGLLGRLAAKLPETVIPGSTEFHYDPAKEDAKGGGPIRFSDGRVLLPDGRMMKPPKPGTEFRGVLPGGRVLMKDGQGFFFLKPGGKAFREPRPEEFDEASRGDVSNAIDSMTGGVSSQFGAKYSPGEGAARFMRKAAPAAAGLAASVMLPEGRGVTGPALRALGVGSVAGLTDVAMQASESAEKKAEDSGQLEAPDIDWGRAAFQAAVPAGGEAAAGYTFRAMDKAANRGLLPRQTDSSKPLNVALADAAEEAGIPATRGEQSRNAGRMKLEYAAGRSTPGAQAHQDFRERQNEAMTNSVTGALDPLKGSVDATDRRTLGGEIQSGVQRAVDAHELAARGFYHSFEASGGTVDASSLIDAVRDAMGPTKEASEYFHQLAGPLKAKVGHIANLLPRMPTLEEANAPIRAANNEILRKNPIGTAGLQRTYTTEELSALPEGFRNVILGGLSLQPELTEKQVYDAWEAKAKKLLSKVPPTALESVRKLLVTQAGDPNKRYAALQGKDAIDELLANATGGPDVVKARENWSRARAIEDKDRNAGLANVLSKPATEDVAKLIKADNPTEIYQLMKLAKERNDGKLKAATRLAYISDVLKVADPEYTGRPKFGGLKQRLGLDDTGVRAVLEQDWKNPAIPSHLRMLFTGDDEGRAILRRIATTAEVADRGMANFNPSGSAAAIQSLGVMHQGGSSVVSAAGGNPGPMLKFLASLATYRGAAKGFFSNEGTRWLQAGLTGKPMLQKNMTAKQMANLIQGLNVAANAVSAYDDRTSGGQK